MVNVAQFSLGYVTGKQFHPGIVTVTQSDVEYFTFFVGNFRHFLAFCVIHGDGFFAESVSYTHLDVYKRQQPDDLLLAKMDARLIVQVLINLLDNAIKYTPSDSQITIAAKRNGETVCVSVADNGNGIEGEQKSRVFDMFYTGANKIVDCRRSIGLGLSLCKSIINAHGGEITITDNVPHGEMCIRDSVKTQIKNGLSDMTQEISVPLRSSLDGVPLLQD